MEHNHHRRGITLPPIDVITGSSPSLPLPQIPPISELYRDASPALGLASASPHVVNTERFSNSSAARLGPTAFHNSSPFAQHPHHHNIPLQNFHSQQQQQQQQLNFPPQHHIPHPPPPPPSTTHSQHHHHLPAHPSSSSSYNTPLHHHRILPSLLPPLHYSQLIPFDASVSSLKNIHSSTASNASLSDKLSLSLPFQRALSSTPLQHQPSQSASNSNTVATTAAGYSAYPPAEHIDTLSPTPIDHHQPSPRPKKAASTRKRRASNGIKNKTTTKGKAAGKTKQLTDSDTANLKKKPSMTLSNPAAASASAATPAAAANASGFSSNSSSNVGTPSRYSHHAFGSPSISTPHINGSKVYNTSSKSRTKMSSVYSDRLTNLEPGASQQGKNYYKIGPGPPKTSRFYKSLLENKNDANSSTHHYNPYLYLQHRTRVNPPLDFTLTDTRENVSENYQYNALDETEVLLNDEIDVNNINSEEDLKPKELPVFYMSEDEFRNPIDFTEKIAHIGRRYGAIKVVPPSSWSTTFSLNTELFWFRSRRQLLNNFKSEMDARLEFYYDLFNYHYLINKKKNAASILNKLPSIDKRTLDLYRLRRYVKLRGGFHIVCKKKLWAQIGRELGYSGRIMTSLSSSLKSAYQRVILDFDEYEAKHESSSKDTANANGKRGLNDDSEEQQRKKIKLHSILNKDGIDVNDSSSEQDIFNEKLGFKNANSFIHSLEDLPVILGSSVEYKRPRDILRSKGFHTYFNNITEEKKSITKKDKYTLASYNFYDWFNQSLLNILDTSSYDSKLAPLYNLKQFFEKNVKFEESILHQFAEALGVDPNNKYQQPPLKPKGKGKQDGPIIMYDAQQQPQQHQQQKQNKKASKRGTPQSQPKPGANRWASSDFFKPEDEKLETMYWKVLFDKTSSYEVESGVDVNSTVHESAFPTISVPMPMIDDKIKESLDPWNLNNFPTSDKSLLRFLDDDDYSAITRPSLMVGMMFSTESWNIEDHYLHKVSYNHLGSTRVWYTIPPAYQQKYEQLVKNVTRNKRENFKDDEDVSKEKEILRNENASVVFDVQNNFSIQEYLNCSIENKVQAFLDNDRFMHQENGIFNKYFTKTKANLTRFDRTSKSTRARMKSRIKELPVWYNQDTFFPPEYLIKNGIPVYKTFQKPGQYIIKFPRTYSANVSLGFTVGESVNYAPLSWIDQAFEAEKWLCKQNIVPSFPAIKLLINIAKHKSTTKDERLKEKIRPLFSKFYNTEIELRQKFAKLFPKVEPELLSVSSIDYKDTISDHNLETCYPSKVVLYTQKTFFQVSLHNFLQVYESNKKFSKLIDGNKLGVKFQVYYTDKELKKISSLLFANVNDTKEWLDHFHEFMSQNPKPELSQLKELLSEGSVLYESLPEYRNLRKFISEAYAWIKNAQIMLRALTNDHAKGQPLLKADFVQLVIDAIPSLQFKCSEIHQLEILADRIQEYNAKVKEFLQVPKHSIDDFNKLIKEGESFGIALKSLGLLTRIVKRMKWRKRVVEVLNRKVLIDNLTTLEELSEEGKKFGSKEDATYVKKISERVEEGKALDQRVHNFLKSDLVRIQDLKLILDGLERVPLYPQTRALIDNFYTDHSTVEVKLDEILKSLHSCQKMTQKEIAIRQKLEHNLKITYEHGEDSDKLDTQSILPPSNKTRARSPSGSATPGPRPFKRSGSGKNSKHSTNEDEKNNNDATENDSTTYDDDGISELSEPMYRTEGLISREEDDYLREYSIKFDGTSNDQRPTYTDVLTLLDNVKRLEIGSPKVEELEAALRATNMWRSECMQLFMQDTILSYRETLKEVLLDTNALNKCSFGISEFDVYHPEEAESQFLTRQPHCFCRKSEGYGRMIRCDKCSEWYHERCLKRYGVYQNIPDDGFICSVCDKDAMQRKFLRPKFKEVLYTYFTARNLLICPDELLILTDIIKDASLFLHEVNGLLAMNEDFETEETDVLKIKFYLRKFESAGIWFDYESAKLRERIEVLENGPVETSDNEGGDDHDGSNDNHGTDGKDDNDEKPSNKKQGNDNESISTSKDTDADSKNNLSMSFGRSSILLN